MNEEISGQIERITYHNSENGFCVLKIKTSEKKDLVTVTGNAAALQVGEGIKASGAWAFHKDFGEQFQAQTIQTLPPNSREGMIKFLGSGLVKGVGAHFAKLIVGAFGEKTFSVLDDEPDRLRSIPGIGAVRLERIKASWKDQRIIRDIMVFLQSYGISVNKAIRIFKNYGERSIAVLKENPYRLAHEIFGIGFKSADHIALKLGFAEDSPLRIRAALHYVLSESVQDGHVAFPRIELLEKTRELLSVSPDLSEEALAAELAEHKLTQANIEGTEVIYLNVFFKAEKSIAEILKSLAEDTPIWSEINIPTAIPWTEEKLNIKFADNQKKAIELALKSKVAVITGGPGTGKTTLTQAIIQILRAKKIEIGLCSPTGRAAKRLSECTQLPAKTIHRFLKFDPKAGGFQYHDNSPVPFQLILVDEVSMVDTMLFWNLLKAIPKTASLILIGDSDQLPSVGPGQILKDLIDSQTIPCVKLDKIYRQAQASQIVTAAHEINSGNFPDITQKETSDFYFISQEEPDKAVALILDLVKTRIPRKFNIDPIRQIQVLCPMQRGTVGAKHLNQELQKALNPNPFFYVENFGYRFGVGDKVMVIQNDYDKDVFNGDLGYIQQIDPEEKEVAVDFEDRLVSFEFHELDLLVPAYTITIHKSQGSEYPVVILPLFTQHYMMLKRNLVYTGITRGKKLVIVVGQKKALAMAIQSQNQTRRWTNLKHWLRN